MRMVQADAVIFDLDGTLADTLADIASAMNHALVEIGLPPHPSGAYRRFVGEGVERLAERAVPPDRQDLRPTVLDRYRLRYAAHLLDETRPYPGVPALLDALAVRGLKLAVLSNKPDAPTREIMDRLFARWSWTAVAGQRPDMPRKPDPTAALAIAAALGTPPQRCLFVGDSRIDMETARAARMIPVGVLWGFRDREELARHGAQTLLAAPGDLLALLG